MNIMLVGKKNNLIVAGALSACLMLGIVSDAFAQATQPAQGAAGQPAGTVTDLIESGMDAPGEVRLLVNRSRVVTTKRPIARVSVGQPETATVNPLSPMSFLVTAKAPGNTQVIAWDQQERSQVIDLTVQFDMKSLADQIKALYPGTNVNSQVWNGTITLSGSVSDLETAEQITQMAQSYSPKVINLLKVPQGGQVMLQVRFAEVSKTAISQLGVNLNAVNGSGFGSTNVGGFNNIPIFPSEGLVGANGATANGIILSGERALNPAVTLFGGGQIGSFYFETLVQTLRQNNLLRVLAEPNLTAASGQEARFLAGGDYPVPVAQAGGTGAATVTIEYQQYGVKLVFVPVIMGDGRIRLKMAPEVSDIDYSNAVQTAGFLVPGRRTRSVSTTVDLVGGQTLAIAGLLDNRVASNKEAIPLLGDLPVLGTLFRSVRYQRSETELMVLVTPRVVSALNPDQVRPVMGEKWRHPSELDLFLNADIGGPEPTTRPSGTIPPRMFIGATGLAKEASK
jgi:pilus assembly protein CpaC